MDWLTDNWLLLLPTVILLVDKIVALSPTKYDDMIWTGVKAIIAKVKK